MSDLLGDVVFSVSDLTKLLKTTLEVLSTGSHLKARFPTSVPHPADTGISVERCERSHTGGDVQAEILAHTFCSKMAICFGHWEHLLYEKRGTYQILCETMVRSGKETSSHCWRNANGLSPRPDSLTHPLNAPCHATRNELAS